MDTPGRIAELERKFGDNPRRYFAALANEYRKAGQLDKAIELCEQHLAEQRNHLSGHVVLAQALVDAGRPEAAWGSLHTALDLDPENFIALRMLGDLSGAAGDADQARAYYFRALEIEPRNEQLLGALKALGQRRTAGEPSDAAPFAGAPSASTSGEPFAAAPIGFETTSLAAEDEEPPMRAVQLTELDSTHALADDAIDAAEPLAEGLPEPLADPGSELQDAMQARSDAEEVQPAHEEWPSWESAAGTESSEPAEVSGAAEAAEAAEFAGPAEISEAVYPEATPDTESVDGYAERTTPSPPLVSETMVGLYLSQGHTALAIAALRELVAARPEDDRIRARLEELEHVTPPERRETVRDLFARIGRPRAAATPATPRGGGSPLDALFEDHGGNRDPEDPAIAAALAGDSPPGTSTDFDSWLTELREP